MSEDGAAVDEVEASGRQRITRHIVLQDLQIVGRDPIEKPGVDVGGHDRACISNLFTEPFRN